MILPRPRTVLFALSGAAILYGILLPLSHLGDLPAFFAAFAGSCFYIILGVVGCVLTMMWNSASLTKEWLGVAELSLKAVGAILFLMFGQLFAYRQSERAATDKKNADTYQAQLTAAAELQGKIDREAKKRQDEDAVYRLNAERADEMLRQFSQSRDQPTIRKAAVAVAGGHLRDERLGSLVLAQAIHTAQLYDPDPGVRDVARQVLFPDESQSPLKTDFAESVLGFLTGPNNAAKAQQSPYKEYLGLIADRHNNRGFADRARKALQNTAVAEFTLATTDTHLASLTTAGDSGVAEPTPLEPPAAPVPATSVLLVTASANRDDLTKRVANLLVNTAPEKVEQTLEALPRSISRDVAPRVYLHIASEEQRASAKSFQSALIAKGFIVPGIQNVAGKARVPSKGEVRYFDDGSRTLERAREIAGIVGGLQLSLEKPSARDLQISSDIASHFEVWLAVPPTAR